MTGSVEYGELPDVDEALHKAGFMKMNRVCRTEDIPENGMKKVEVDGGLNVLVLNSDGRYFAYQAVCPHQEVELCEGLFDGRTLTCHEHLWQWDVETGAPIGLAEAALQPPLQCAVFFHPKCRSKHRRQYERLPPRPNRRTLTFERKSFQLIGHHIPCRKTIDATVSEACRPHSCRIDLEQLRFGCPLWVRFGSRCRST